MIGHICLEKIGRTQQHGCDSAPTELHGQRLYLALPGKGRSSVVLWGCMILYIGDHGWTIQQYYIFGIVTIRFGTIGIGLG